MPVIGGINVPKLGTGPKVGPGKTVGLALPKPPKQPLFGTLPKAPAPKQTNPYDTFNVADPYVPGTIDKTATAGYNTDVANANKLAAMGELTPDQETARAASQAANVKSLYDTLAQQIAGIQGVSVGQTNAGTAALGAANSATAAAGNPVSGALGVANPGVIGGQGAQAVLASGGAAQGNELGALQGAAYASGASGQAKALASGQSNIQTDQLNTQKALQSLLAGVSPVSARESTMQTANSTVDAANKATELSLYQSGVTQQENEDALGEKKLANAQGLANKKLLAGMSNAEKTKLNLQNNQTKTTIATNADITKGDIAASGNRTKAQIAAANRAAANQRANAGNQTRLTVADISAGKKIAGAKTYAVTVKYPATTELVQGKVTVIPAKTKSVPINSAQWNAYVSSGAPGQRKLNRLGLPNGAKVIYAVKKS